jgi:hypothetical protein
MSNHKLDTLERDTILASLLWYQHVLMTGREPEGAQRKAIFDVAGDGAKNGVLSPEDIDDLLEKLGLATVLALSAKAVLSSTPRAKDESEIALDLIQEAVCDLEVLADGVRNEAILEKMKAHLYRHRPHLADSYRPGL